MPDNPSDTFLSKKLKRKFVAFSWTKDYFIDAILALLCFETLSKN